jgi:hypothetical protein
MPVLTKHLAETAMLLVRSQQHPPDDFIYENRGAVLLRRAFARSSHAPASQHRETVFMK